MPRDIVYFDLETRRTANDVGGWGNKHKMGVSVAVTYSTKLQEYLIYTEDEIADLVHQMVRADLVVGFNHISFDYEVLLGHTVFDFRDQLRSLDLLVELEQKLGHRLKLEAVAAATLGTGKTADGLEAIRWWQQGKMAEIAEYCCYDVKVTKCIHEYGAKHGHVKYHDRNGREQIVAVEWSTD
ncbi:MAG: ribonuclease H-like domain-containing protein [Verrucomicrobiales bacterium]|nr:ribonuclease H-like domain-containing protein [Verrucomicrobiales bacterium]MCP5557814.1 ribonuclease H-like domain-containing protein [Verrucomicrobiaceae bacterium]